MTTTRMISDVDLEHMKRTTNDAVTRALRAAYTGAPTPTLRAELAADERIADLEQQCAALRVALQEERSECARLRLLLRLAQYDMLAAADVLSGAVGE